MICEGISVPTHSCILAALSPYLSEKLSASPSPPSGQKRQLQLQAVGAQTLLKLVGLLYSGELEVKGGAEQNDVLSAARQFGITDLVEGQKDVGVKEGEPREKSHGRCRERNESRKMQDAQIQAEMAGRRSLVSTGTQTVNAGEKTDGISFTGQTNTPTQEPASSVAQCLDFSISFQPQDISLDEHLCSTSYSPLIPSMPCGAPSDGESALDRSSDSVTNPTSTSALSSNKISLNDDSCSRTPQEDGTYQQQPPERQTDGKMADSRESSRGQLSREEMPGEEKGNPPEKRHANVGMKSLAKMKRMQQIMEAAQISIKVRGS